MSRLDITFCDSDCKNKECERNQSKIPRGFCVTCVNFSKDCENYKRMTNADQIRSMSDEELAIFIDSHVPCFEFCMCEDHICKEKCKEGILRWLKSEVE